MSEAVTVDAITRRRKRFRLRGWIVWPLVLVALAAGGFVWMQSRSTANATVHYTTTAAATGDVTVIVTAVGTVEPIQQVNVGSLISGTISQIDVAVNDTVKVGQVLAKLDTSSLEAGLARDEATLTARLADVEDAKAALEATVDALTRAQSLRDKGFGTAADLTTATTTKRRAGAAMASALANVEVAKADVQLSKTNMDKAIIVAPIDGTVLDLAATLGQTVSANTNTVTLFTLAHDLGQMQLQVDVDEADIGKVEVGDIASFTVDAYLGRIFPAKVSEMHYAPHTVDGIVTYATILAIDNSDHKLRPGMTASADVTVEQVKNVLTVPNSAFRYAPPAREVEAQQTKGLLGMLFSGGNRKQPPTKNEATKEGFRTLFLMKDGQPTQIAVKTGVTDGNMTQVLEGPLVAADVVITAQSAGAR